MSRRAWVYVLGMIGAGAALIGATAHGYQQSLFEWPLFVALTALATIAHLFKAKGPNHEAWNANLVFYFAGLMLLPPFFFALLILIPHLVEWAKERLLKTNSLRKWYIQPFNISTHLVAGFVAR